MGANEKSAKEKDTKTKETDAKETVAKTNSKEKIGKARVKELVAEKKAAIEEDNWRSRIIQLILVGICPSLMLFMVYVCYCREKLYSRDVAYLTRSTTPGAHDTTRTLMRVDNHAD